MRCYTRAMRLQRCLLLVGVLLLSACALSKQVPERAEIRSVGVAAAIPDVLRLRYVGLTAFNNTAEVAAIDWRLEETALAALESALQGRYATKRLAIDLSGLRATRSSVRDFTGVSAYLKQITPPGAVDIIVLADGVSVLKPSEPEVRRYNFSEAPPPVAGALFGYARGAASAGYYFTAAVFDGRTFEMLGFDFENDSRQLPDQGWRGEPYVQMPAVTKAAIRAAVEQSIRESVPRRLRTLGLLP
jgi:hypothetical protein